MTKPNSQLKAGAIISYVQIFLHMIILFVSTPILLKGMGDSEYGLFQTLYSIISMLSILSLGFGQAYIRYFARYKTEEAQEKIDKLNGLFLLVFTIIGIVVLACGLFLAFNLKLVYSDGLTAKEYETGKVLTIIFTFTLMLSFPRSVFANIISAHERFVVLKLLTLISACASPLLSMLAVMIGGKSIVVALVGLGSAFILDSAYVLYVFFKLKCKFVFHGFEKGLFKEILVFTSFIAINLIVDQVNNSIGKILLGRYSGTVAVAVYSVAYTVYLAYMSFSTSVSGVFTPRVHKMATEFKDDESKLKVGFTELFTKVGRVQYIILALIVSGFVFFGQPFIKIWAGADKWEAYYVAIILMIAATIPFMQNLGIEIQRALNRHQFRSIVYIGMAILNVVATIFLSQEYGAIGAAIGTAGSLVIANCFIMNIYYHKKCYINIWAFWKSILRLSLGLIIPIAFGVCIMLFIPLSNIWIMLALICAYALVYCGSMWLFGMNNFEKDLIRKPIKKIIGKFIKKKPNQE